ncbi:sensor histidine kinase [Frateuria soli]|uniref:sensor histidine kinase n=1 Tax=Frateuria soli TaxID=1542730 RepID=UPI001E42344E|nr:ATP-binding protein [Frateuria soli]UGB39200.1 ATP-binding protein [Frateuria soli]
MRRRAIGRPFAFRPVMSLVAAGLLLLAGALAAGYQYHSAAAEHRRQLTVQAKILAASVTAAISFNDRVAAQEYVNALMLDPRLDAAAVYNEAHRLVAGFQRPGSEPIVDSLANGGRLPRDRMVVAVPAQQGSTTVGSVYLRAAPTPLIMQLARYSGVTLLTLMAVLMLSALAVAHRLLMRANAALERRARELASANERLNSEMEQRARTEEALRQSQKMEAIGQLSGGIAHDFNNLLMIIRASLARLSRHVQQSDPATERELQLEREGVATGQDAPAMPADDLAMFEQRQDRHRQIQRYLDMARDGIDRAASLTQRLLTFARRQPLSPRSVRLDVLIQGMQPLLDHSVGSSWKIDYRLDSQWPVLCDSNQMENAILNLVINARDAMPEGGTIRVCTDDLQVAASHPVGELAAGDYVRLRVVDTGVGMSEEVRSKAFDPFFTTKPVGKGTGLGLSTILGYVEQSRGVASIESRPGHGTTIHIILPRAPRETIPEVA